MTHDVLQAQLERWAVAHYHEGAQIRGLHAMPGHAGLSFGFVVADATGDIDKLVVRMPPKGVRRAGNTDVLRQVPLLQQLGAAGVRVAPVVWWDADEQWFEVPYFMVRYLSGSPYNVRAPSPAFKGVPLADLFRAAVEALASAHRVDVRDWEQPKSLEVEVDQWVPLMQKAAEKDWIGMAERTREVLLACLPSETHVGVFHGDFQTNNVLFDGSEVVAIVDWEISGIGAQLIDIGWFLFVNDAASWYDGESYLSVVPSFKEIVGWYSAAVGRTITLDDLAFYRALSAYRFGVISGLNVMLHRTGKRHDPEWERIGMSVPLFFRSACQLLGTSLR